MRAGGDGGAEAMTSRVLIVALLLAGCTAQTSSLPGRLRRHDATGGDEASLTQYDTDDGGAAARTSSGTPREGFVAPGRSGPTAFAKAAPYALVTPAEESSDHHGGTSNANKDCLSCHAGGLNAPRFLVAGTVYLDRPGNAPAVGAQVRVVAPDGEEVALVGTDSAGNFWVAAAERTPPVTLPPGSFVGVRDATSTKEMKAAVQTGSCNQSGCHVKPRPISLE